MKTKFLITVDVDTSPIEFICVYTTHQPHWTHNPLMPVCTTCMYCALSCPSWVPTHCKFFLLLVPCCFCPRADWSRGWLLTGSFESGWWSHPPLQTHCQTQNWWKCVILIFYNSSSSSSSKPSLSSKIICKALWPEYLFAILISCDMQAYKQSYF